MKFLHLADLHIGKKLNGFNLLKDQEHILRQGLNIMKEYAADAVVIAGDIYDSQYPPVEAVKLLDWFITEILKNGKLLFVIPGNHDSAERLSFGKEVMKLSGLYIEGAFKGYSTQIELTDEYGKIFVHMLPFVKPLSFNYCGEAAGGDFNDAIKHVIENMDVNANHRNILIAHQFVTAKGQPPEQCDSEIISVGGIDNVDYSIFNKFDYVALGHLHCPQKIGRDTVVYAGSPLKYSISERFHRKSAALVNVLEKGRVETERIPFKPLRDLRQIKGTLEELLEQKESDDYVSVVLTGGKRYIEPYKRLREIYENCISVEYEDIETNADNDFNLGLQINDITQKSHLEVFEMFYNESNGESLDNAMRMYLSQIMDEIIDGDGGAI